MKRLRGYLYITMALLFVFLSACTNNAEISTSIQLPETMSITQDQTADLKAIVEGDSDATIVWSVKDPTVVYLTRPSSLLPANVKIRGLKVGVTTVTAELANGASASCVVTVTEKLVPSPEPKPVAELIHVGVDKEMDIADIVGLTENGYESLSILNKDIAILQENKIIGKTEGYTYLKYVKEGKENLIKVSVTAPENRLQTITVTQEQNPLLNYYGRSSYSESFAAEMFYYTGAGFEASFYGTKLSARLVKDDAGDIGNRTGTDTDTVLGLFFDGSYKGDRVEPDLIVKLQYSQETEHVLIDDLPEGIHTVKVLKRTAYMRGHDQMTTVGLRSLSTDGYFVHTYDAPNLKIEVYGDSVTCAYGNLTDGVTMTSDNTDGLMGYQYILGRMLDASVNTVAASGWGLYKGLSNATNTGWAMNAVAGTKYFERIVPLKPGSWDFDKFSADIVIINLGANDYNANVFNSAGEIAAFTQAYTDFIGKLRAVYPSAYILCTYSMTIKPNDQAIFSAIENAVENANDDKVKTYFYKNRTAVAHPLVAAHLTAAEELYDFITENGMI